MFTRLVGVSPKRYVEAAKLRTLRTELRGAASVTEAIYAAGFGSGSRVYERVDGRIGMTPRQYREGGRGVTMTFVVRPTAIGWLLMAATDRGICSIRIGDDADALAEELRGEYPAATISAMPNATIHELQRWIAALERHVAEGGPSPSLPLDVRGTAFQIRVWSFLQRIPSGEVVSYAEVAAGVGQPTATRAAARACASNPVALLIPCHRVIRGDGSLGGYRWGTDRKRALLDRERRHRTA